MAVGRVVLLGRRRVEEPAPQAREVGEAAVAALVERVRRVPLDRVGEDDVVGVERGAFSKTTLSRRVQVQSEVRVRLALGRQDRDRLRAADLEAVEGSLICCRTRSASRRFVGALDPGRSPFWIQTSWVAVAGF